MATPRVLVTGFASEASHDGMGRVMRLVCRVLAARDGIAARGLTLANAEPTTDLGIPVATARGSRLRFVLAAQRAAFDCSHVVHTSCNMAQAHPRIPGLALPSLTFLHGVEVWESARPRWIRAARRATVRVCNTRYTRDRADRVHGGFSDALTCWLGTESDEPPSHTSGAVASRPPELVIAGRIERDGYKGHDELVACWPRVVEAVPAARLHVVGAGTGLEELRARVAASPVASRIRVHGFLGDAELEALYGRVRAFAMPSRAEGFGLVYVEAMRHGLPVLAASEGAAPEVVRDGETGYLVEPGRPEPLVARLAALLGDAARADRLGRAGQARWREHFRFGCFEARFGAILDRFLEEPSRARRTRPAPLAAP